MKKTILLTGATDGIGLETAKQLVGSGHELLLHGRDRAKLNAIEAQLRDINPDATLYLYQADLTRLSDVATMAGQIKAYHQHIDVLINNAGVYTRPESSASEELDPRYAVNTIAPFLLTTLLARKMGRTGRVINVASAAQIPIQACELIKPASGPDGSVYGKSKLALIMWTYGMAVSFVPDSPQYIAVNPKSLLGSKMVKNAYGIDGAALSIGADILCRAALSSEFDNASGKYWDNDIEQFARPHPDGTSITKTRQLLQILESIVCPYTQDAVET